MNLLHVKYVYREGIINRKTSYKSVIKVVYD